MNAATEDNEDKDMLMQAGFSEQQITALHRFMSGWNQPYVRQSELSELIERLPTKVDLKDLEIRMLKMMFGQGLAIVGLIFAMFKFL